MRNSFQTPIQATPSPLTPLTPAQAIYTIVNNDEVNAVNIALDLTEIDSLDDTNAVQFDGSMTCPESGTLGQANMHHRARFCAYRRG